jgi:hypothetical protein
MRLDHDVAVTWLAASDHGVLCTVHGERGADAVPAVFAVVGDHVGVPVDRVKPKAQVSLQRTSNLEADPRATLLVDHWDRSDWSQLWWVRANLRWLPDPDAELVDALAASLRERYPQYRVGRADAAVGDVVSPFAGILVLQVVGITGWAATTVNREPKTSSCD